METKLLGRIEWDILLRRVINGNLCSFHWSLPFWPFSFAMKFIFFCGDHWSISQELRLAPFAFRAFLNFLPHTAFFWVKCWYDSKIFMGIFPCNYMIYCRYSGHKNWKFTFRLLKCTRANKYYFLDDLVPTVVIQNASRNSRSGVEAFSKGTR